MPKKETGEATANERVEQAVEEIMKLSENTGNEITLAEIGEHLSKIKLNKDQIDEVYDLVEKNGISIVDTREPNGNELDDVEDEDDSDDGVVLKNNGRSMLMLQFLNLFLPMMPSECTSRRSERYRC